MKSVIFPYYCLIHTFTALGRLRFNFALVAFVLSGDNSQEMPSFTFILEIEHDCHDLH